jgi:DNA-binding FrmR family transcriptional regulator
MGIGQPAGSGGDRGAPGYSERKDAVRRRLRRIEGQVRGLQRMVEDDRYCIDVLEQVAAATRALQAVALELLDDHLSHCVAEAVKTGGSEATAKIDEASAAIARLVRS